MYGHIEFFTPAVFANRSRRFVAVLSTGPHAVRLRTVLSARMHACQRLHLRLRYLLIMHRWAA